MHQQEPKSHTACSTPGEEQGWMLHSPLSRIFFLERAHRFPAGADCLPAIGYPQLSTCSLQRPFLSAQLCSAEGLEKPSCSRGFVHPVLLWAALTLTQVLAPRTSSALNSADIMVRLLAMRTFPRTHTHIYCNSSISSKHLAETVVFLREGITGNWLLILATSSIRTQGKKAQ